MWEENQETRKKRANLLSLHRVVFPRRQPQQKRAVRRSEGNEGIFLCRWRSLSPSLSLQNQNPNRRLSKQKRTTNQQRRRKHAKPHKILQVLLNNSPTKRLRLLHESSRSTLSRASKTFSTVLSRSTPSCNVKFDVIRKALEHGSNSIWTI